MAETSSQHVASEQLRLFIERIETLEQEKRELADQVRDVYAEAKGTGFDGKAMREVIKLRRIDRNSRMEQEAILDTYKTALGLA